MSTVDSPPVVNASLIVNVNEYFDRIEEYGLVVCKRCRYTVWPREIRGHLKSNKHRKSKKEADAIADIVCAWSGLVQSPDDLRIPSTVAKPFEQLHVHIDGLECTLDPDNCHYISRTAERMRKHWQGTHRWRAGLENGGGSGNRLKQSVQRCREGAMKSIKCQRFFTSRQGSQYFAIKPANDDQMIEEVTKPAFEEYMNKVDKKIEEVQKKAREVIQEGKKGDSTPWLDRTRWPKYLSKCKITELLACIDGPAMVEEDKKSKKKHHQAEMSQEEQRLEEIDTVIWNTMETTIRFSQQSVIDRVGIFVRMEAIRTEKSQNRFQPLQPYMDESTLSKHMEPWMHIMMFFARTQRKHNWTSPKYQFTKKQRRAFKVFWVEAKKIVDGHGEEAENEEENEEAHLNEEEYLNEEEEEKKRRKN